MSFDIETDSVGFHSKTTVTFTPKYASYSCCKERLKTFKGWSEQIRQKPKELCQNGFFYEGFGDCVTCFACGIKLRNWCVDDNIRFEHNKWSPSCSYLKMTSSFD